MTKQNVLVVRNIEQAACWLELDGQLSDGFWENSRPYDHWKVWCDAVVKVAEPNSEVGRTFYAKRSTYNFCAKELLDVVQLRMLGIVRIARRCGIEAATVLKHAVDCDTGRIAWGETWNSERIGMLARLGVTTQDVDGALADESYTLRNMRADLRDLMTIVRTSLDDRD